MTRIEELKNDLKTLEQRKAHLETNINCITYAIKQHNQALEKFEHYKRFIEMCIEKTNKLLEEEAMKK